MIYLFINSKIPCPGCDTLKEKLNEENISYQEVELESIMGRKFSAKFKIFHVPTIFVMDNGKPKRRFNEYKPGLVEELRRRK